MEDTLFVQKKADREPLSNLSNMTFGCGSILLNNKYKERLQTPGPTRNLFEEEFSTESNNRTEEYHDQLGI